MSKQSESENVLESLASLPSFHHPTASPDGERVAVYYDDTGRNELHLIDVGSGERTVVTDGEVPRNARWPMEWGPDGETIYYHQDEGGNEQNDVWRIDRDGKKAEPVVELDSQVSLEAVADDGTVYVGSTAGGQMNLYRQLPAARDDGEREIEQLTEYERAVWGGEVSPDGDRIAYATNESDVYDNLDVYVANPDGSEPRNLEIGEVGSESAPTEWDEAGEQLLLSDNVADMSRAGVYDFDAEEVTWYGDAEYEEVPVGFTDDESGILVVRTRRAAKVPVVYDLESGEGRELDVPEGVTVPAGGGAGASAGSPLLSEDRLLLTHTTPARRPELLAYDLDADETEVLLEAAYGPFDPEDFADAEYFRFESDGIPETSQAAVEHDPYDELEIEALFYDSGERPSPLIVNPHGGPRHADSRSFDLYTQFLAQQGYSVLKINYRGSTGRGKAFVEELYEDWGGAEQGDVATAAEVALDRYDFLDDDRVVVFGGSYGGYSAYWQLVQYPDLYDAGIAWIGLTDLNAMFEETMPHFRTELMEKNLGTPEQNPDLYRERSPIEYADNLAAPTLMVHGVNDRRVPVSQARLFRDRLEELGYEADEDFEYVELGEEGHASSDIDQKIRLFETLADFLERRS
ncbi:dipeptidyl aminopeptidases/acylaminoacyl-peptidase [Salinarchaeum sp. Harcht-Bsk1]|uniref:S9 family peptidase n=1 Tax=Salinarchaeum sp. Harcht-Bsk1 TaxID=1333523 RepID=UPI0003423414|nr:prolyl oligopeptidase family serine peptidase [Salinarchaeum sp. Harcht-Bsk1]AGN01763.1 dipeptidyl aminopeptidases/acylaminoacyl-peptidase [Salinarchaeum sp. Harcht-Bsk1]